MIGKVAANERGIVGIVTERRRHYPNETTTGWCWEWSGISLDNNLWSSVEPIVIADSVEAYINQRLASVTPGYDRPRTQ